MKSMAKFTLIFSCLVSISSLITLAHDRGGLSSNESIRGSSKAQSQQQERKAVLTKDARYLLITNLSHAQTEGQILVSFQKIKFLRTLAAINEKKKIKYPLKLQIR